MTLKLKHDDRIVLKAKMAQNHKLRLYNIYKVRRNTFPLSIITFADFLKEII